MLKLKLPKFIKQSFCTLPVSMALATETLFHPFEGGINKSFEMKVNTFEKLIGVAAVIVAFIYAKKFQGRILIIFILAVVFFITLMLESLYEYNDLIQHTYIILKVCSLFIALAFYGFYTGLNKTNFHLSFNSIVLGLIMKLILRLDMLSLNAFIHHDRGLPASTR